MDIYDIYELRDNSEKYSEYEVVIIKELVIRLWTKKFGTELNPKQSYPFIANLRILRKELIEKFSLYPLRKTTDLENDHPRQLRDNIIAALNNDKSKLPPKRTIEALCALYYSDYPKDKKHWYFYDWSLLRNWHRFIKEVENSLGLDESIIKRAITLSNKLDSLSYKNVKYSDEEISKNENTLMKIIEKIEKLEGGVVTPKLFGINLLSLKQTNTATICLLSIIFLIGLALCISNSTFPTNYKHLHDSSLKQVSAISAVQVIMITFLIYLYYNKSIGGKRYIDQLKDNSIVTASLQQLQSCWMAVWISLFFLYLWLTFRWWWQGNFTIPIEVSSSKLYSITSTGNKLTSSNYAIVLNASIKFNFISAIFTDFFNLCSSMLYLFLYYIMDSKSVATVTNISRNKRFKKEIKVILIVSICLLTLTVVDRYAVVNKEIVAFFGSGVYILAYSLFSVVAMSLFFSRLNSPFFEAKRRLRPFLYIYAAAQAGYEFLGRVDDPRTFFTLIIVLALKLILFIEVNDLIRSERFKNYFYNMLLQLSTQKD